MRAARVSSRFVLGETLFVTLQLGYLEAADLIWIIKTCESVKKDKNSGRILLLWKSEGCIHIFLSTYREDFTATLSRNKTLIPVISYNIKILLGPLTGLLNWSLRFRRTFWSLDTRVLGPNVLYENGHRRAVNKKPPLLLSEGDSRGRFSKLWLTTTLYLPRLPCPPGWMLYTASAGPQEQESCCLIITVKGAFKSFYFGVTKWVLKMPRWTIFWRTNKDLFIKGSQIQIR